MKEIDRAGFVKRILQPGKGTKRKETWRKTKKKTPVEQKARTYPVKRKTDAEKWAEMQEEASKEWPVTARSKSKPNVRKPTTKRSDKINKKDGGPIRLKSGGPVVDSYDY
jgi:hypothetical protein